jgi:epoxyqueuosine reductase
VISGDGSAPCPDEEPATLFADVGIELLGVVRVDPDSPPRRRTRAEHEYSRWIEEGMHGGMHYLDRNKRLRYRAEEVLSGCRSVLVVALNYYQVATYGSERGYGRVARYAWGRDYHNVLGRRLRRVVRELRNRHPDDAFRAFVDASPLSERYYAEETGIGFTGRNTLTIAGSYGSWCVLGEVLTTRSYSPTGTNGEAHGSCPSGCFRCGQACPTGALVGPHRIDAGRCISYLTIEHRGSIAEELRPLIGDWIFGCDLCQECCPLNVRCAPTSVTDFAKHRAGERLRLEEILNLSDEEFRARFTGTPLLRPGRDAFVRNACIVAANTGSSELLPLLRRLAHDHSSLVREHACWAIDVLTRKSRAETGTQDQERL